MTTDILLLHVRFFLFKYYTIYRTDFSWVKKRMFIVHCLLTEATEAQNKFVRSVLNGLNKAQILPQEIWKKVIWNHRRCICVSRQASIIGFNFPS